MCICVYAYASVCVQGPSVVSLADGVGDEMRVQRGMLPGGPFY